MESKPHGPFDVRFKANIKLILAGGSGSGKTTFVLKLFQHCEIMMVKPPKIIYYYYQLHQPIFKTMKETSLIPIHFRQGVPTAEHIEVISEQSDIPGPALICMDDCGQYLDRNIANLFQVASHHSNLHVLLLLQNIFTKSPYMRDISLSASDMILFKSPRDSQFAQFVGKQILPQHAKEFVKIFREATSLP